MEEVEGANRAALDSCNSVLYLLSQPEVAQDPLLCRNLTMGTGEAVGKFKKVVSLLGRTAGHARARMSKILPIANVPMLKGFESNQSEMVNYHQAEGFLNLNSNAGENIKVESGTSSVTRSVVCSENPSLSLEIGLNYSNQAAQIEKHQLVKTAQQHHQLQQQRIQQHQLMKYRFQQQQQAEMMFTRSNSGMSLKFESSSCTPTMSSNRSFMSSLSMDGSVADVNGGAFQYFGASHSLDHSLRVQKKKCGGRGENGSLKCGSSRCHCSKKRKHRVKRSIKVPAISSKIADIPSDDYSWRKYGQKPIKGSPYPRGYYKCSSMRGCPARKHVERSLEEPTMLIVTYEGEHNHPRTQTQSAMHEVQHSVLF